MNTMQHKTSALPLFAARWILTLLLCLSALTPGISGFSNVQAAPAVTPVVDTNYDLNLPINTTAKIDPSLLHARDADNALADPATLQFTLVTAVSSGALKLGANQLNQSSTFTQKDINDGILAYEAPGSVSTASFTFTVAIGAAKTAAQTYTIHINKPEPTVYPALFTAAADSVSQITTTWTDTPGPTAPDGYLVLCSPYGISAPSDTANPLDNPCTDGSGSLHVPSGVGRAVWEGLNSETTYHFAIFPYTRTPYTQASGAFTDYLTSGTLPDASATTLKTYSISGSVGMMSALIGAGGGHDAYSEEDGSFTITDLTPGVYTLTPAKINYFFTPDRRDYANVTTDQFVQSFSAHRLNVLANGFTAQWNGLIGATGYTFDVATDTNFNSFVTGYEALEVGNVTRYEVTGLAPQSHYFFRVRAHDDLQADGYSTPVEVLTAIPLYFPFISNQPLPGKGDEG